MDNKIERLIDDLEAYIDNCKYQPLSKTNIVVNKDEIDELLRQLRTNTPEEIRRYQRLVSNSEAILNDARQKAENLVQQTAIETNRMVSEHEIMQQAYARADEVVKLATRQAQDILDRATMEANEVRSSSIQYLDDMLASLENMMTTTLNTVNTYYDNFYTTINGYNETIKANRAELLPPDVEEILQDDIAAAATATAATTAVNEGNTTDESIHLDLLPNQ